MQYKTVDALVRIAAAGGGMRLDASAKTTDDLIRIAAAASTTKALIFLRGWETRREDELIRIAAAGHGSVIFE